jgi:ArsR family transcriptional regulator
VRRDPDGICQSRIHAQGQLPTFAIAQKRFTHPGNPSRTVYFLAMTVPLYQAKAEMFRNLGHPVRIRVLELLQAGPRPVSDLRAEIDVEAANLSQQLAVLRRAGIVVSYREDGLVMYALSTPAVADLLAAGRRILREVLTDRDGLLAQLQAGASG